MQFIEILYFLDKCSSKIGKYGCNFCNFNKVTLDIKNSIKNEDQSDNHSQCHTEVQTLLMLIVNLLKPS